MEVLAHLNFHVGHFKLLRQLRFKPSSMKNKTNRQKTNPGYSLGPPFTYFSSTSVSGENSFPVRNVKGAGQLLTQNNLTKQSTSLGPPWAPGVRPAQVRTWWGRSTAARVLPQSQTAEGSVLISGMLLLLNLLRIGFVCLFCFWNSPLGNAFRLSNPKYFLNLSLPSISTARVLM